MEHLTVLLLSAAVVYLLNCKVIVLQSSNRVRVFRTGTKAAPAVICDRGVTKALETANKAAELELSSALVNLGCKKLKALEVAKKAMLQSADFDSRLVWALQNAA